MTGRLKLGRRPDQRFPLLLAYSLSLFLFKRPNSPSLATLGLIVHEIFGPFAQPHLDAPLIGSP
jgi:hypothetical protein